MFTIKTRAHFAAAHWLPEHLGKCKNLHGHRWEIDFELETDSADPTTRMIIDFGDLKKITRGVCEKYDHKCLNDFFDNESGKHPTAEQIAVTIHSETMALLRPHMGGQVWNLTVHVQEAPNNTVSYTDEIWHEGDKDAPVSARDPFNPNPVC